MLADVCEDDYPDLSEASSKATKTASLSPENAQVIQQWTNEVEISDDADWDFEEVENLTITELKHRCLQLKKQQRGVSEVISPSLSPFPVPQSSLEPLPSSEIQDTGWSRAPRILLVEDNPTVRQIVRS
jgi:hypothetical protein